MSYVARILSGLSLIVTLFSASTLAEQTVELGAVQPIKRLVGHQGSVVAIDWSPDGKWIATGGADCTLQIWDAESGQCKHRLTYQNARATDVAFSGDSRVVVAGSLDGTTTFVDVGTGKILSRYRADMHVHAVALNDDGSIAAGGCCNEGGARVYGVRGGAIADVEILGEVLSVAFSPDSKGLAVAWSKDSGKGGELLVVDLVTNAKRRLPSKSAAFGLSFDANGRNVYFMESGVMKMDLASGTMTSLFPRSGNMIPGRFFSRDHASAVISYPGSLSVLNLSDPNKPERKLPITGGYVRCLAISPDGKQVAVGEGKKPFVTHEVELREKESVRYDVLIYDTASTVTESVVSVPVAQPHDLMIVPGKAIATLSKKSKENLVDLETGKVVGKVPSRLDVLWPTISKERKFELVQDRSRLVVYDTETHKPVHRLAFKTIGLPASATFASDSASVYLGCSNDWQEHTKEEPRHQIVQLNVGVYQIELTTSKILKKFDTENSGVRGIALDEKLRRLAVSTAAFNQRGNDVPAAVRILDTESGQLIKKIDVNRECRGVVTSSGIAYACDLGAIVRVDLATGQQLESFELHEDEYHKIVLSPDERQVLVLGKERATLIDRDSGKAIRTWKFPTNTLGQIGFDGEKPFLVLIVQNRGWQFYWLT